MRKTLVTRRYTLLMIILIVTLACNMPMIANTGDGTPTSTKATDPTQTVSQATSSPTVPADTPTNTVTVIPPTDTSTATSTNIPPTSTNTQVPTPCNRAQFVSDVNYPDGTEVTINTNFTKTWRLMNTGSCPWTSGYKIIFDSGDRMGAPDETVLTGGSIPPGATADISVQLKAPGTIGTYQAYFRLKSPDNVVFGINGAANDAFWVQIKSIGYQLLIPKIPGFKLVPTKTPTPIKLIPKIPIIKVTLKFP